MPKKKTTPGTSSNGVDTAEPGKASKALSDSERKYKDLVETISDVVYEIDPQGVVSYISPAVSSFGYSPAEVIGRTFSEFLHAEDLPQVLASVQNAFAGDPKPYEVRIVTKSGESRWVRSTARPVLDGDTVVGIRGVMRDTTDRRRAEEALRESAENFRALSENAHDGIVIVDGGGRFVYANRRFSEISGYDLDELLEMSMGTLIHPDYVSQMMEILRERIAGEEASNQYEVAGIRKDGVMVPVEFTAARTTWHGSPAVMGVVRDITERKQVDEALRLAEFSLDHASISAFWMGPDARFIYVNDAACQKLGYTREELLSMAVFDIDPNFPKEVWADHWEDVKTRGSFTIESVHQAKDGTRFPVEITVNYMEFEGREYNFAFARDITARKRTQDALEERLRFESLTAELSAAFINLPAGKIDEEIDSGLQRLLEHLGIDRATVIELAEETGRLRVTHSVAAPGFEPTRPLVEMPEFSWGVQQIRNGKIIRYSRVEELPDEAEFEKKHFLKEGPKSNVTIPLMVGGTILGGVAFGTLRAEREWSDEMVQGLQLVGQIIASALVRKRADQALRKSEQEKATILDSVEELVSYQDRDLRVVWANRAAGKTVETTSGALVGRHCYEIWNQRQDPCPDCPVVRALHSGQPEASEVTSVDGRVWSIRGYPVRGDDGEITGVVEVTLEITARKHTEEALRESEERHRRLFESMAQGVVYQDAEGAIVAANPAAERILGLSLDQMMGRTSMDPRWKAVREDGSDFPGDAHPAMEALRTGREVQHVVMGVFNPANEEYRWILVNAVPQFRPGETQPYQVFATFDDITDRRRAAEALRTSELQYRTTLDSMGDAIHVVDRDLRITLFNKTFTDWNARLGLDADVVGKNLFDVFPFLPVRIREEYERVFATGEPLHTGESVDVTGEEFFTDTTKIPVFHEGRVDRVVTVVRDVTAKKRADEELAKAQALLEAAIEETPAGILVADAPDVRIRLANSAALGTRGETSESLTNIPVELHPQNWQTFHPDGTPFKPEDLPLSRAILEGKTSRNVEAIIRRHSGEERWVLANAAPVRNVKGEIVAGVVVFPDVTEIKRAEEERQKLQAQIQHTQKLESLGILAGGIAHDFNNLLMGVLGNAELAMSDLPPTAPTQENLKSIETAAKRAADLCRQMLAYSGKGRFLVQALDLNAVVGEMAQLVEVSISKTVALSYGLAQDLPTIEADATQIRQIVLNLITNASEAIGDSQGVIKIATGVVSCSHEDLAETYMGHELPEGDYVYVDVTDTGCGMDAETVERIFDPFFTTKFTGRGLGLAAVLGIVRGHEGALRVTSQPGEGTEFRVLFPVSGRPADTTVEEEKPEPKEWQASGTILVVDDEDTVRSVTKRMLERKGFTVMTAGDGGEGVELYRQHMGKITAVILDLTMPRMGGDEAFEEFRRINPDVQVILASGYSEQELSERFADRGLAGFIQKPFKVETILQRLREAMDEE
jgi:PAS domain S-box-containing protein